MEKAPRSKGTIVLRYLQKAATFTITNNPHSPRSSAGERQPAIRGASGPIASIIPTAARHKKRNDYDAFNEEPTSPKVTCIGQIKHKKSSAAPAKARKKEKIAFGLTRILSQRIRPDHKEMEVREKKKKKKEKKPELAAVAATAAPAPALGQLKKFASRRETLMDFDWEKAAAAAAAEEDSDYEGKEDLVNIYHSAPLVLGGDVMAAEHKEIGLWRRRSMSVLMPLQVQK